MSSSFRIIVTSFVLGILSWILYQVVPEGQSLSTTDIAQWSNGWTIAVTGANSGVGYATVEQLARAGTAQLLILLCRHPGRCREARERAVRVLPRNSTMQLQVLPLDLADFFSVQDCAKSLTNVLQSTVRNKNETVGRLDVLVNNAGIFATSPTKVYRHGIEEHMLVNHLGHAYLTHLLWPVLQRVVFVSSISALLPVWPSYGWWYDDHDGGLLRLGRRHPVGRSMVDSLVSYARTKRANLLFAHELHRRYGGRQVESVASHPGYARTDIWTNGAKVFPRWISKWIQNNLLFSMSSQNGAKTQILAALHREGVPSGNYVGPRWWLLGRPAVLGAIVPAEQSLPSSHHWKFSKEQGHELWEETMRALNITEFGTVSEALQE